MTEAEKKVDEGEGEDEEPKTMKEYLMPADTYVIIEKEWVIFCLLTLVIYLIHLVWMCYGVDVYASYERHVPCECDGTAGKTCTPDENSAVYDTWILLCIIFHMVEWIRQTIFATSALVGVNLVGVFYALYIMIPYGVIVMFGGAIAAFMSPATCQENQPNRSLYLKL